MSNKAFIGESLIHSLKRFDTDSFRNDTAVIGNMIDFAFVSIWRKKNRLYKATGKYDLKCKLLNSL